ncbi:MAG: hypothetical protein SNJ82_12640 [Gemmataceae bacterium]
MRTRTSNLLLFIGINGLLLILLMGPGGTTAPLVARETPGIDADEVLRLLNDLDDDAFDVRQRADLRLRALGPAILPWLLDEYERNPSFEVRDRVRRMIRDLQSRLAEH